MHEQKKIQNPESLKAHAAHDKVNLNLILTNKNLITLNI